MKLNILNKMQIKNWLYTFLIAIFTVNLVLAQETDEVKSNPKIPMIDGIIAVIGNEIVLRSDLESQLMQMKQSGMRKSDIKPCEILEDLLIEKLMLNQARLDSLDVSEDQINQEIERRVKYIVSRLGSREKFEEFYGKPIVEFKEEMRDPVEGMLLAQRMQGEIAQDVKITPADVRAFFKTIPEDSLPLIPIQVEVAQIVKMPIVSEKEEERVMQKLGQFRRDVLGGKDFGTIAILYSEDPGSAANGGELGMVPRGTMVPEFDAVAFTLMDGEVSDVFRTDFGYHIMQMIQRRGDQYNARHILLKPRVSTSQLNEARAFLDSVRSVIVADSISFADAAEKFSTDKETKNNGGKLLNENSGGAKFSYEELDPQLYYTVEKLKVGEISQPVLVQSRDGSQAYRLLKVVRRLDAHKANLRDDYTMLQELATQQKQATEMESWIKRIAAQTYTYLDDQFHNCEFEFNWNFKKKEN
jgi:peptidyl-prolyl cis-trans isomerase SurA